MPVACIPSGATLKTPSSRHIVTSRRPSWCDLKCCQRVKLEHWTNLRLLILFLRPSFLFAVNSFRSMSSFLSETTFLFYTNSNTSPFSIMTIPFTLLMLPFEPSVYLLLFYVLATSKVISGRVPTCDSAHPLASLQCCLAGTPGHQYHDLNSHSVILSWHWANQSLPYPNIAKRYKVAMSAHSHKSVPVLIFWQAIARSKMKTNK